MHTFKEYLKETSISNIKNSDIQETFDVLFDISKNIGPFLKEIGGPKNLSKRILWRGLSSNIQLIKPIRKNRKPTDTEENVSMVVDDWFLKNFKSRFRSNAIFAIGRELQASNFGTPVIILPKGKFSFVWSPIINDLFKKDLFRLKTKLALSSQIFPIETQTTKTNFDLSLLSLDTKSLKFVLNQNKISIDAKTIKSAVKDVTNSIIAGLNKAKYQNNNLDTAIKSSNEIMISGKEYYVISIEVSIFVNLRKLLQKEKLLSIPENIFKYQEELFILKILELILQGKITK